MRRRAVCVHVEEHTNQIRVHTYIALSKAVFDKVVPKLPDARMGGAMYTSYEFIKTLFSYGARDSLFNLFHVLCAGKLPVDHSETL